MLRIVWDARSTVCRTASVKLSGDRPDSSMNFTTDIVPSLMFRAGYGPPEMAGMQLGAGVVRAQRHLRVIVASPGEKRRKRRARNQFAPALRGSAICGLGDARLLALI